MRRTEGRGEAIRRFRDEICRICSKEYRHYRLAVRRVIDRAVEELGLGEEIGTRVLQSVVEREMMDSELSYHRYWGQNSDRMPAPLCNEAISHKVEEAFIERSYMGLLKAKKEIREQELLEKREKKWKAISQSGELHFLFVEGNWDRELFYESSDETNRMVERMGLDPQTTLIRMLAKQGRDNDEECEEFGLYFHIGEIKQYCKKGARLRLYLHDVRRVPRKEMSPLVRPTGLQELYEDHHLNAYLGEAKFGTKSFPWYLGGHALSRHLSSWLRECRKELQEHGRLTEAEAQRLLVELGERHEEAKSRSLELLRKTVGRKAVDRFMKLGSLLVKSANGRVYRITRNCEVVDTSTGKKVCVQVDSDEGLPIYDDILAKYLVIRDHPEQIETLEPDFEWDEVIPASLGEQICARTGVGKDELAERIVRKQEELAYQVTALGAAMLVAQELGVEVGSEAHREETK